MMLSRVADHLYWLARFAERAENTARLISVATHLQLDLPRVVRPGWQPLLAITGNETLFQRYYHRDLSEASVVKFLIADQRNPGSILQSLQWARENSRTIRDFIPREAWEQINELHRTATAEVYMGLSQNHRYDYLKRLILGVQALTGLLAGTMNHDAGYRFLKIGRNLERADMTSRILDVLTVELTKTIPDNEHRTYPSIIRMSVLNSLGGYQMYRRQMQQVLEWEPVLNFLFKNREFPRSFLHCLGEIRSSIMPLLNHQRPLQRLVELEQRLAAFQPELCNQAQLHQFIDELQLGLGVLHQAIGEEYFNAPPPSESEPESKLRRSPLNSKPTAQR